MKDGTLCDLNSQPRQTRVLYVCYPAGKNQIYSFKEVNINRYNMHELSDTSYVQVSTCEYELVVLTSILCSHPRLVVS